MKLLFDEHISFRMVRALLDVFPKAKHVKYFNLEQVSDDGIWRFAKKEGYAIVTKDDDFHQKSLTLGHPPKVIWLKINNANSKELEAFIRNKASVMGEFIEKAAKRCYC